MDRDFTLDKYSSFCEAISVSNYTTFTVEEIIRKKQEVSEPFLILRHDVDRSPKNAYKMAKIESKNGIKATYYFRTIKLATLFLLIRDYQYTISIKKIILS